MSAARYLGSGRPALPCALPQNRPRSSPARSSPLPPLLLADEPTGNLDSHTGTEILDLLGRLRAERGMTMLIATHEQHVAARCDRLIRPRDGRVVDDIDLSIGEPAEATLQRATGLRT